MVSLGVTWLGDNLYINGKKYSKIYEDLNTGNLIGINLSTPYQDFDGQESHKFTPTQDIIKPNIPNKPGFFEVYTQYPGKADIIQQHFIDKSKEQYAK